MKLSGKFVKKYFCEFILIIFDLKINFDVFPIFKFLKFFSPENLKMENFFLLHGIRY